MLLGRGRRKIKSPFPILPLLSSVSLGGKRRRRRGGGDQKMDTHKTFPVPRSLPLLSREKRGKKKALPPKGRQGWAGGLPLPTFFFVLLLSSWNESPEINNFLGCTVHNRVTVVNVLGENLTRKREGGKGRECASGPLLFFYHPAPLYQETLFP